MIRCILEMCPGGDVSRAHRIGLVEIAKVGGTPDSRNYVVTCKKSPPFKGALVAAWRRGVLKAETADVEVLVGQVEGHDPRRRGAYDLLYRALAACGMDSRNP